MNSRILIRGGCVLTLGNRTQNYPEADVLVEEGMIAEIGPGLRARDAETVDARDTVVMPGFVDTHRHVWKSLIRNLGKSAGEAGAAADVGRRYEPQDLYAATLIGLLGAVESGITTVVDWSDLQVDDDFTDAALQAHSDAGLRTILIHSLPSWSDKDGGAALRRTVARTDVSRAMTLIAAGASEIEASGIETVAEEIEMARELGLRIHAHAGRLEHDAGAVADLAARGLLGDDVTLVHCTRLDDADLDAVVSSGASVSLAPSNEMTEGHGSPPLQRIIDRGIRPGLGVDSERVAPGDMFAPMREAISLQHATYFDLRLAGKAGLPNLLNTREVIKYATADGARAAGLGKVTGSLEVGKQADIIVLRTDRPNIAPVNDPIGAVVWGMDTSNIDWVFAAGKALMRNGSLEADVERARELAITAQRRVAPSGGLLAEATAGESS